MSIGLSPKSFLDQAFSRAAGARRIEGNCVRLLHDATENYPAWLDAIASAERDITFENYIIRDDASGRRLAAALTAKAREGVAVRVLYDWLGAVGRTRGRFWRSLREGGIEVRCFNPFRPASPLGWVHRNHRKSLVVDGCIGFITGLCVADEWAGDPARGVAPWRDTGVEIRGPAVAEIERAFARVCALAGPPLPAAERGEAPEARPAGDVAVRIVASEPNEAELLRLDQLIAAAARETLWLSDAYYAGLPSHVQALRAAARDGVDVRLLVPGATDVPLLQPLSRAGYRPLLEAGVRVFEWNGPMLHAKTAVADGRWARVGSSNLNVASWLGNYELDAVIEDADFAGLLARQYEEDLGNATEIVLRERRRPVRRAAPPPASAPTGPSRPRGFRRPGGSAGRAAAGALRIGNTVTAAVRRQRVLETTDAGIVAAAGLVLITAAVAAVYWPRLFAIPVAALATWVGAALLARAYRMRRRRQAGVERQAAPATEDAALRAAPAGAAPEGQTRAPR